MNEGVGIAPRPRGSHAACRAEPSPLEDALEFAEQVRSQPHCVVAAAVSRNWDIFTRLCREAAAKGNRVPDAYLAALAIESGCEWVTTDRGLARFPGLR